MNAAFTWRMLTPTKPTATGRAESTATESFWSCAYHATVTGSFTRKVLALLRSQHAETDKLVSALYGQGLTQSQVGEVFERLYGRHYSSSQVGRMIDWMREDVAEWNSRPLEARYPTIFIDALWVNVRRDSVRKEASYVVLGVKEDRTREVLAISHQPEESATVWRMLLEELRDRGVTLNWINCS